MAQLVRLMWRLAPGHSRQVREPIVVRKRFSLFLSFFLSLVLVAFEEVVVAKVGSVRGQAGSCVPLARLYRPIIGAGIVIC